ncbi:hypothetical protein K431DRAFT_283985 [Polychaeton citri CBS 116435]|uniref:C3H1-type domain-containing protein n=1 Tax=Polychaeton citri CBS 116435 TaxID=1314669 RepID=A0A9P4QC80_9PEZI|nr:hypothetical protein K431DRAFT_283985 [Polychaeton citri CBS 116435]
MFCDSYVERGVVGGREAAIDLYALIKDELTKDKRFESSWKLIVRIFVNMEGFVQAYQTYGVAQCSTVRDFVKGFNRERVFFEFIDAGDDKEAADGRIHKNFELFWDNVHCKSIVLGGSGDKGYTRFLREYTQTEEDRQRITLLEARPHARNMSDIAAGLLQIQAPELFRQNDFRDDPRRISSSGSNTSQSPPASSSSYAGVVSTVAGADQQVDTPSKEQVSTTAKEGFTATNATSPTAVTLSFDRHGQRIDLPLKYDKALRDQFMKRNPRFCFDYHLSQCTRASCVFAHGQKMVSTTALDTLRSMARSLQCFDPDCRRPDCYYGHRRPHGGHSFKGKACGFRTEMQGVNTTIGC